MKPNFVQGLLMGAILGISFVLVIDWITDGPQLRAKGRVECINACCTVVADTTNCWVAWEDGALLNTKKMPMGCVRNDKGQCELHGIESTTKPAVRETKGDK